MCKRTRFKFFPYLLIIWAYFHRAELWQKLITQKCMYFWPYVDKAKMRLKGVQLFWKLLTKSWKIKINACLPNAFCPYDYGVKSKRLLSYELSKRQKWNPNTLYIHELNKYDKTHCEYICYSSVKLSVSAKPTIFFERRPAETYIHDNWLDLDVTNKYLKRYCAINIAGSQHKVLVSYFLYKSIIQKYPVNRYQKSFQISRNRDRKIIWHLSFRRWHHIHLAFPFSNFLPIGLSDVPILNSPFKIVKVPRFWSFFLYHVSKHDFLKNMNVQIKLCNEKHLIICFVIFGTRATNIEWESSITSHMPTNWLLPSEITIMNTVTYNSFFLMFY